MNGWPTTTLGELFEIARGGSPRPIENFITDSAEGVNWVSISDASDSSKFISATKRRILPSGVSRSRTVKPGDLLLTNSMSFGRPYIMNTTGCIHDGWLVLSDRHNDTDANYFFHLLGSPVIYSEFERLAAGVTVKNLNIDLVRGVRVPKPPLAEQQRIANILDAADALRAKRRAAIEEVDSLSQAIFVEMFNSSQLKSWRLMTVEEMASPVPGAIRTGPFGSQLLHSEFTTAGVAVLGIDNVVANEFQWRERRYISAEKYQELERYTVRPGDVLITIMGTCGRCAVVPDDIPLAINTKHLCCISLDSTKCTPSYLHHYFLRHPMARSYLGRVAKGAIMDGLNMGLIKAMPIPLAPLPLQQEFARRIAAVETLKAAHRASLAELDALFASLQHRAFRGEL